MTQHYIYNTFLFHLSVSFIIPYGVTAHLINIYIELFVKTNFCNSTFGGPKVEKFSGKRKKKCV